MSADAEHLVFGWLFPLLVVAVQPAVPVVRSAANKSAETQHLDEVSFREHPLRIR
jgi:hypothetical protein